MTRLFWHLIVRPNLSNWNVWNLGVNSPFLFWTYHEKSESCMVNKLCTKSSPSVTVDNEFDFQIDFYNLSWFAVLASCPWDRVGVHLDDRYHKYRLSFSIILGIYNGTSTVVRWRVMMVQRLTWYSSQN